MITLEHAGPFHAQLADAATREVVPFFVHDLHPVREDRHAGEVLRQIDRPGRDDLRHRGAGELDHPVAFEEQRRDGTADPSHLLKALREIARHNVGAARPHFHAGEISLFRAGVEQCLVHRRNADEHVRLLVFDEIEDPLRLEVPEHLIRDSAQHQRDRRRQPHDVRDRQRGHCGAQRQRQTGRLQRSGRQHGEQPVVREARALRSAGGSARVHHGDDGVAGRTDGRHRGTDLARAREQVDCSLRRADRKPSLDLGQLAARADSALERPGIADQRGRAGQLDQCPNLFALQHGIDRDRDAAGAHDGKERQQEIDPVGRDDGHELSQRQPFFRESGRETSDDSVDVGEGHLLLAAEGGLFVQTERDPVAVNRPKPLGQIPDREVAPQREENATRQEGGERPAKRRERVGHHANRMTIARPKTPQ